MKGSNAMSRPKKLKFYLDRQASGVTAMKEYSLIQHQFLFPNRILSHMLKG